MKLLIQLLLITLIHFVMSGEPDSRRLEEPIEETSPADTTAPQVTTPLVSNATTTMDQVTTPPTPDHAELAPASSSAPQDTTAPKVAQVDLDNATIPAPTQAPAPEQQANGTSPDQAPTTMPPVPTTTSPYYPSCTIESGFNFVGNDIGIRFASQADYCCSFCSSTPNCKAFSWSLSPRGGICYLKSGRGRIVVDSNYKSALVFPAGYQPGYPVYDNINIVGLDVGQRQAPSYAGCYTWCRFVPGCRAFSFSPSNGGTCWLKSTMDRTVVKNSYKSGRIYPEPIYPSTALESTTDYVNNDIGTGSSATPQGCVNVCMRRPGCRAFSWTNYNGGTCWLKNLQGDTVQSNSVTSGQVYANPVPPSCSLQLDVDYVDNDIGNVPSNDPYKCCSICLKTNGCRAFSWSDHNGGTCWLKSRKNWMIYKQGVKSAVV